MIGGVIINNKPQFYQKECADQVYNLVCKGKRKITILVPAGAGKTLISVLIAEKICTSYQKAFIVAERQEIEAACNGVIQDLGVDSIQCITLDRLIAEKMNADLYVLYSLRPTARKRIAEFLGEINNSIVVSLGEPHFEASGMEIDYLF